jgi:DNA-binding response OmpR family regulator
MLKVLIVEDESIVAFEISNYLQSLDCEVIEIVSNGLDAIKVVENSHIDLIIMDIFLEGEKNGIDTAWEIKQSYKDIMIMFLTANSNDYNIKKAIEVEPLVYLSKPFDRKELYASINMAKNRLKSIKPRILYLDSEFSLDTQNRFLYHKEKEVHLTKKESELLNFLIKNQNNIVSNYMIEYELWPDENASSNRIRTLIQRLRKKLDRKFIKTIPKRGYIFNI